MLCNDQGCPNTTYNHFHSESDGFSNAIIHTVKPALIGHSIIDKTKVLKTNGSFMKVESIAEYF